MSANLLKEFDVFYQVTPSNTASAAHPTESHSPSKSYTDLTWGFENQSDTKLSIPQIQETLTRIGEDDWGDFEAAEIENPVSEVASSKVNDETTIISNHPAILTDEPQYIEVTKPLMIPALTHATNVLPLAQMPVGTKIHRSADIIFDAEAEGDEEDDFGDYEGLTEPIIPAVPSYASVSSSLPESFPPTVPRRSHISRSQEVHGHNQDAQKNSMISTSAETVLGAAKGSTSRPNDLFPLPTVQAVRKDYTQTLEEDEPWPEFTESLPPPTRQVTSTPMRSAPSREKKVGNSSTADDVSTGRGSIVFDLVTTLPAKQTMLNDADVGPLNIPPPAVIIPLFSLIVNLTEDRFFEPLGTSSSSPAMRTAILHDTRTQEFLISYIAIATVLGYVIAGRKHRWKRDKLLTQSMRIGSASSSGKSGMKLVGIDKSENTREEREVADVIRVWRAQCGKLRSAVSGAGISQSIPELAEFLVVRSGTAAEGAMPSAKACALCGLQREERVRKVDFIVEDSFGEWWVEHWGHRACRHFWAAQRNTLAK